MNKRLIILYWMLLLIPTIVISISVFHLLGHEQERINHAARSSAMERASSIAETLQVTIDAVEDELTETMFQIPAANLERTLLKWEESNPLVRNIFIWKPEGGLQYPLSGTAATNEERRFVARYMALFSGRIPWNSFSDNAQNDDSMQSSYQAQSKREPPDLVQEIRKLKTGRKKLVSMAKGDSINISESSAKMPTVKKSGWIPWFEENRLYILGWVQPDQNRPVYGVELELMALLSRLIVDFPTFTPRGMVFALIDGDGHILHQAGKSVIESSIDPDFSVSLAPHLPHWQVAGYIPDKSLAIKADRSFLVLSGLLLCIFIAAIVLGGILLTWQAHRNMKDAMQKTSFVSSVSHELKTPLTSIRMYAELLDEDRIKNQDKRKHYLQVIVEESKRLTRLVNNVLDFGRLEQGKKKYRQEELELRDFLNDFIDAHGMRIQEAGIEVKTTLPDQSITVFTDRDALNQVLINLVDNAVKYAANGKELVIELQSQDSTCMIKVIDQGPGIPQQHRKKIFKKFHRVDDSLTSQKPGSGLGLTIAKRLLNDLGGDIVYEPLKQGGSCFMVILPRENKSTKDSYKKD